MKRGFTLIELLVVIAMILVIMGAFTSSVQEARKQAQIAKATQETREMTNAFLAYEQYAKNRSLSEKTTGGSWRDCLEGDMAMLLGGQTGASGEKIPVLFNGVVVRGYLRDPWGMPYQYMIEKTGDLSSSLNEGQLCTAAALPNRNRLNDDEKLPTEETEDAQ